MAFISSPLVSPGSGIRVERNAEHVGDTECHAVERPESRRIFEAGDLLAVAGSAERFLCRLHEFDQFAAVVVHGGHPRVPPHAYDAPFPAADSAARLRINDARHPALPLGW